MAEDDGWGEAGARLLLVEGGLTLEKVTSVKIGLWVCLGITVFVLIASMLGLE